MKALFLIVIFSAALCTFTQASSPDFGVQTENFYKFMNAEAQEERSYFVLSQFLAELNSLLDKFHLIKDMVPKSADQKIRVMDLLNEIETGVVCDTCQNTINNFREHVDVNKFQTWFEKIANTICAKHLNESVCLGAIQSYANIVFTAVMDKTFEAHKICEKVFLCPKTDRKEKLKEYLDMILKDKPATSYPIPTRKSTYTLLHLTDPHIDLQYQEGSNANCTEPLCCRAESGAPVNPAEAAQYWGTLAHCDAPLRTFDQFLQYASTNFDVDMIIWTGDNIAHDIWHQNQSNQTHTTQVLTQEIVKYFPNTKIYPMFGNHEAFPADEFDFVGNGSQWLTNELADLWSMWLDPEADKVFRNGSYYSTVNAEHNVKVIALDTVACDTMDFYLIEDPTDPDGQLEWLRTELYDSEAKNQSVFIMAHIPPGDFGCDSRWSERYRGLIDRFTNIVRGQFFGHTHNDQIEIVRSYADNSSVGVAFIAPSFTTFSNLNPSFRIFEIDSETNQPLDYFQFRLDLNKWNQNTTGPLQWDLAYSVVSEYNLVDTNFTSFALMVEDMKKNENVAEDYIYNFQSGANPRQKPTTRDLQHYYCEASHAVSENAFECLGIDANTGDLLAMLEQIIPGSWTWDNC